MMRNRIAATLLVLFFGGANRVVQSADLGDQAPTYGQFVAPVLSKAGCNSGACHGYRSGRGGMKLSLRGEAPNEDYRALIEFASRRLDRIRPDNSLILLKPAGQVPHEGGQRFSTSSRPYALLRAWIAAGTPPPDKNDARLVELTVTPPTRVVFQPERTVQLRVMAKFDDGNQPDVTELAVYEASSPLATVSSAGLVESKDPGETTVMVRFLGKQQAAALAFMPARPDFVFKHPPVTNHVDRHVFAKLQQLKINPADVCSDHVFVRRAFLDTIGLPPTADQARAFVTSTQGDKRAQLIDHLLAREEFGEHWALKWSDLLRNEEKTLDPYGVEVFHAWIRDWFNEGKPLDLFARELIVARGSTYEHPPANFWRALRDPLTRGEAAARVLLGVRLQCAKCHNHPTGRWTQDDYYGWAGMFARIDYRIVDNNRKDKLDKHEFTGEQIVLIKEQGEVTNARTGNDATAKLLGGDTAPSESKTDRLEKIADWIVDPANRWFARAQVNRIWYHIMGRGLVEPVDDLRATNPPSHPALMDDLCTQFVAGGYDVRQLIRTIMNSTAYQLGYETNDTNIGDPTNYSRALVRRLTAEQMLDALCQFFDVAAEFNGYPEGTRAGQLAGVRRVRPREKKPTLDEQFLAQFGKPERLLSCECERSNTTTLPHALISISGPLVSQRISHEANRVAQLLDSGRAEKEIIDELFWSAVSRPPKAQEVEAIGQLITEIGREAAFQDVAWALINSKEFIFRY